MKKHKNVPYQLRSLTEAHQMLGLPKPEHPLISLINNIDNTIEFSRLPHPHISPFYKISYKTNLSGQLKYGQDVYDFDKGGLFFISPNQAVAIGENNSDYSGYSLLVHPDFFLTYPLAKSIKQYGFFSYATNEALYLSEKEKTSIISVFNSIENELSSPIDDFSQNIIISQIELLLNYSNRFYKRQFISRKAVHNRLLITLEEILSSYFKDNIALNQGLPTVQYLANSLNLSPSYLSDMLRTLTGQNTQQHIHNHLIEKAKEKLSVTALSISEIAYELGFEHPQSFSKLFKAKTNLSPMKFRARFN